MSGTIRVTEPIDFAKLLFDPNGRIGRGPYWAGWGITVAAGAVAGFIPFVGLIISVGLIYCNICIFGKRLHDMGKSAWIYGVYVILSFIAIIVAAVIFLIPVVLNAENFDSMPEMEIFQLLFTSAAPLLIVGLVSWLIGVAIWLWCGIAEGEQGDNQYGPNPRQYIEVGSAAE